MAHETSHTIDQLIIHAALTPLLSQAVDVTTPPISDSIRGHVVILLLFVLGSCVGTRASGNVGDVSGPIVFSADVFFEPSSVALEPSKLKSLSHAVEQAKGWDRTPVCIYVTGHASGPEAPAETLDALAAARAKAVADWIRPQVGPAFKINVAARGANQSAAPPPDQRNARVEVEFVTWQQPQSCTP